MDDIGVEPFGAQLLECAPCAFHEKEDAVATCGECDRHLCPACEADARFGFEVLCSSCRPPAPAPAKATTLGTIWQRLAAFLLDWLVLDVLRAGAAAALGWEILKEDPSSVLQMLLLLVVLSGLYNIVCWTVFGATPGKALLGLRVVHADGSDLTLSTSVVRWLGYLLSSIPLGLGFVVAYSDKRRRTWHDRLAGTRVVSRRRGS